MGLEAGAAALFDLLGGAAAAAPEAAAAVAPEVAAGTIALPEIAVTAAAPEVAAAGAGAAGAAGAAEAGFSAADLGGILGAGALGITPAAAAGLSPSSVVSGEFGQLPGGGVDAGTATPIGAVAGFGPGGPPLPTPSPLGVGGAAPGAPGAGGSGALGFSPDVTPTPANPLLNPDTLNTVLPGAAGTAPLSTPTFGGATGAQELAGTGLGGTTVGDFAGGAGGGSTLGTMFGGVGNFLAKNPLLPLGALALGGQLLGPKLAGPLGLNKVPGSENLTGTAAQAGQIAGSQTAYGTALEQPLITGVLPAPQQAAVDKATQDAISTIKGRYASLGLTGSTMEADAIANAQQNAIIEAGKLEQAMAQTGTQAVQTATQALQLESNIYDTIMAATIQQDANLGNAISNFASAAALGTALGQAKTA